MQAEQNFVNHEISIHAPPRGATISAGRDVAFWLISIHAPPRGATRNVQLSDATCNDFNSRPSARGDECRLSTLAQKL